MPRCLVVQHVEPESAFSIAESLVGAGVDIDTRRVFSGDPVPDRCDDIDGLVVMGGPMSANSDDGFPTRSAELALLADAVERAVPTLGVCLGAQLLALATGGSVHGGDRGPEIGWGPVQLDPGCHGDPLFDGLPDHLTVMHWHGETYTPPPGALQLMSNATYPNQGFRSGPAAWGIQFHLEVTGPAVEGFLDAFPGDADRAEGGTDAIRSTSDLAIADLAPSTNTAFGRFATLVVERADRSHLVDHL